MTIQISAQNKVLPNHTETYATFRSYILKPPEEEAHLRHILRFYIARALLKRGETDVFVLPQVTLGEKQLRVDVAAGQAGKYTLGICEPESVTPETEEILEALKDVEGVDVIVVHSRYGSSGNVLTRFQKQLADKKFSLLAVVPPPFDDVYEYDIWMFETTFRNLFESN